MVRKINFSIGEFYHIYNRGTNKSLIFSNDYDYRRFQKLLYLCNGKNPVVFKTIQGLALDKVDRGETIVDIGLYCLMPNHFHMLLHEKVENGISIFLSKISTAYSMYFNKKYERTGTLFEGSFKAEHVDTDEYLKYLFAYIHLNPVKIIDSKWRDEGIKDLEDTKKYLAGYNYSSYLDYISSSREEERIINKSVFPEYFKYFKDFDSFISEWLSFNSSKNLPKTIIG